MVLLVFGSGMFGHGEQLAMVIESAQLMFASVFESQLGIPREIRRCG
jgi:hypothetical protein